MKKLVCAFVLTAVAIAVLYPQRVQAIEMAKDAIVNYMEFRVQYRIIDCDR